MALNSSKVECLCEWPFVMNMLFPKNDHKLADKVRAIHARHINAAHSLLEVASVNAHNLCEATVSSQISHNAQQRLVFR